MRKNHNYESHESRVWFLVLGQGTSNQTLKDTTLFHEDSGLPSEVVAKATRPSRGQCSRRHMKRTKLMLEFVHIYYHCDQSSNYYFVRTCRACTRACTDIFFNFSWNWNQSATAGIESTVGTSTVFVCTNNIRINRHASQTIICSISK